MGLTIVTAMLFCCVFVVKTVGAPDPTPGGDTSASDCDEGEWYDDYNGWCRLCGQCKDNEACDVQTGLCPGDCEKWFYPPNQCWGYINEHADFLTLAHITDGPEVKNLRSDRVEVCFYQNATLVAHDAAQYYAYLIQYAKAGSTEYLDDVDYIRVQSELLIHKDVIGLNSNTEYKFRIALFRVFDQSEYDLLDVSGASLGKTACGTPARPEITQARPRTSLTAIHIQWKAFGWHSCYYYHQIELHYRPTNGSTGEKMLLQESQREVTIHNLIAGLSYVIQIKAFNNELTYSLSEPVQVNLIPEALENEPGSSEKQSQSDDDDSDDTNFYTAIAVAAVAALIAIIALILAISLYIKLKTISANGGNREASRAASNAEQGANNGTNGPPLPSRDAIPAKKYEGLRPRSENPAYDSLHERAYDNSEGNPTYDVL